MSRSMVLATSDDFRAHVLESPLPVVVDFTAAWCAPCRALAPLLDELAERHAGRVRVAVVDVEQAPEVSQDYRVTSMPTLIAFRAGQPVAQLVGYGGRRAVDRLFEELAQGEGRGRTPISAHSHGQERESSPKDVDLGERVVPARWIAAPATTDSCATDACTSPSRSTPGR